MFKRLSWFVSGVAAGAVGAGMAKKKVKAKAESLKPVNVAKAAAGRVRQKGTDIADAVRDGRQAMKDKEAELIALRDGDVSSGSDIIDVSEVVPGAHRTAPPRARRHRKEPSRPQR